MDEQTLKMPVKSALDSFIIRTARQAIETFVKTGKKLPKPKEYPKELEEKRGVFVTIFTKPRELRGCIGLPFPDKPLIEGLIDAAVDVCNDPRFPRLTEEELKDIKIEVSILTKPECIICEPSELSEQIRIGKDGLIIRKDIMGGLFLPQVPVEQGWNMDEYMENLCYKAGLGANEWMDRDCELYKFQTKVISED